MLLNFGAGNGNNLINKAIGSMKLILVRHGQTKENKEHIIQGCDPSIGTLCEQGWEQSRAVAARLATEQIDLIYASDLQRVRILVDLILKYHPHTPVEYQAELREKNFGIFEGKPVSTYLEAFKASNDGPLDYQPPRGESFNELQIRTNSIVEKIRQQPNSLTILICSHGGTIRSLLAKLLNRPLEELLTIAIDNTSVTTLNLKGTHEVELIRLNDSTHTEVVSEQWSI